MTKTQLKQQAAEKFVRDVLGKRNASEKIIKLVAKKVARATPTIQVLEPEKKRA